MEKSINYLTKWLLVFFAIFVPFRELIAYYTVGFAKFIPDALVWILFILVIIKNKFKLHLKSYDYLYIGFLSLGFFSSLINHTSILAYALQFRSITTMYILFYILRNTNLTSKDFKPCVITLIGVTTILITFGIFEHVSSKCLFYPEQWALDINYISNFTRVYSLVKNPNTFAIVIFMTMLIVFYSEEELKYKIPKIYYILVFLGIFLSASRSTLLASCFFFAFLIYYSFKRKSFKKLFMFLCFLAIAFVLSFGLDYLKGQIHYVCQANFLVHDDGNKDPNIPDKPSNDSSSKPSNDSSSKPSNDSSSKPFGDNNAMIDRWHETISGNTLVNSANNGRLFIIKTGLKIFKDYPIFGTGFGTYGSAASKMVTPSLYEKYQLYENFYSDNDYIKIFVETGILGTLIYGAFVISLVAFCWKNKYKLMMLTVFLFIGMFYNVSEMQVMCLILYISLIFFDKKEGEKIVAN